MLPSISNGQDEYRLGHMLSKEDCLADWNYYRNKLEKEHPNLYQYTPQLEMNQFFDSISASITAPMNSVSFYNLITLVLPKIKDGHTHLFPDPDPFSDKDQTPSYFPFKVHWEEGRMFVTRNYSSASQPSAGIEIQLINGVNATFLYNLMMRRQIRDGYNTTYPAWILENYFADYYSYHIGNPAEFVLSCRKSDNTYADFTVKALPKDSIAYYKQMKYGELRGDGLFNTGITLTVDTTLHSGLLTIKDFHNDILKSVYNQKFKDVIQDCFSQIKEKQIEHLILDLRNNQGGDIENGVMLLSYLLNEPFEVVQSYSVVDMKTYQIPIARLKRTSGPGEGMHEPKEDNYKGKLYVLVNGGSFSNTAIVSSVLQTNNRCVFIGEETGGNPGVFAGGGKYVYLPNTNTKILIPNLQYQIRPTVMATGTGLIPDYEVAPILEDILARRDVALYLANQLIIRGSSK